MRIATLLLAAALALPVSLRGQVAGTARPAAPTSGPGDTSSAAAAPGALLNAWGLDIILSDNGVGLGGFYRREFTPDLYGFANIAVTESKDGREVERYDYYQARSFVPGKLNRFLVIPLTFGVQRRLFREDIADNFRPYVNGGLGPALILAAPFTEITPVPGGGFTTRQVEYFTSLGKATAHYTATFFLGAGATFGSDKGNLMGVNFRYYFTYMFDEGLPSLYDEETGLVAANKTNFGGFMITLNVGVLY